MVTRAKRTCRSAMRVECFCVARTDSSYDPVIRSRERLPVQHFPQRETRNSTLCVSGFHQAVQLSCAHHPIGALLAAMAEHVQVVGTAIEHVDETDSGGGRPDLIDHAVPDLGLARTLQSLIRVLVLGSRLAIEHSRPAGPTISPQAASTISELCSKKQSP